MGLNPELDVPMAGLTMICDAAELFGIWGAEIPDVVVIAGFVVTETNKRQLLADVSAQKKTIVGDPQAPIKWNVKDIKRACELHGLKDLQKVILDHSDELREALIEALIEHASALFVSAILAYSNKKQILGKTREDLVGFSFGNVLMRVGLYKSELKTSDDMELILDWPDGSKRDPFVREYCSAWKSGESFGSTAKYSCGALSTLGFLSAPVFGITDLDERLQLADLLTGASRSFTNFALGKAGERDFGVRMFKKLCPRLYRNAQGRAFGRGVTVSPTNSPFSEKILEGLKALGC